ncbi:MAG TPA: universal stress protein [Solirubrobacteraceae bacterium]|jgi:nucleotide-binding universal stress UspA family protein|nr:universal stress protein [Solirubrobacteraceae bacterium]
MYQRILIAWDGSDVALRAFDAAIDLARRYEVELVAASVAYSPAHAETAGDRSESAAAAERYLRETFAEVRDRAERAGVDVEHVVIEGDEPAAALLDHCREHAFDLLVVGHHRSNRAGRLLLRGVAHALLDHASVPVLVVTENGR